MASGIFHIDFQASICRSLQSGDGHSHERFSLARSHLPQAIEVTDTSGVKVKVFGF